MNQAKLVLAISKEIEKQKKLITIGVLNKIVDCANQIIEEVDRKPVLSTSGMSFVSWLASDDTGASSKWLACVLSGFGGGSVAYPYDPSDFGRCYRMLNCVTGAKELFASKKELIAKESHVWKSYLENWDKMEALWERESPTGTCPRLYKLMQELQNIQ